MTSESRYDAGGKLVPVKDYIAVRYAGGTPFAISLRRFEGLPLTALRRDDGPVCEAKEKL